MAFGRVLLTIPSKERVGCFPAMTILIMGIFILMFSFQFYFTQLPLALTKYTYFSSDILDSMQVLVLPISLLYLFVTSQVRIRLNLKFMNGWSITHLVLALITIATSIFYIIARPEQCFAFVNSIMGNESVSDEIVAFLQEFQSKTKSLTEYYSDETKAGYKCLMYFASYSYFLQFFVAMIFASMASSLFGERGVLLAIRSRGDTFEVVCEEQAKKEEKSKKAKNAK